MNPRPRTSPEPVAADGRRSLPSVEGVLQALPPAAVPRPMVVATVRAVLDRIRRQGRGSDLDSVCAAVTAELGRWARQRLRPVINGSGVVLHTNLGRAPLGAAAVKAVAGVAAQYSNLEFDVTTGGRGGRATYLEAALAFATGAPAATVVNNCAAALVLVLRHLTLTRREVLISRGELVQIGGGFRIPEILEASGAILREVGTTNHTTIDDYARALSPAAGLILKVHRSNFRMEGFVAEADTGDLAGLAHEHGIPCVEDLGSGALVATEQANGLEHEPTPSEVLARGVDLVTFSGDKLLGGPQAGIIAGRETLVAALKREPFFRALRCDKLVFAALEATVEEYLAGTAERTLPVHRLLRLGVDELRVRGERIVAMLARPELGLAAVPAEVGGGTLPGSNVPSLALEIDPGAGGADALRASLLQHDPPVVATIGQGRVRIDLRTVFAEQDDQLIDAIRAALLSPP